MFEPDLHLDLSDVEDDEEPAGEILMDERNSCCHRDNSEKDYDGNESTFISYLPEPQDSFDMIPFDQTFENMDAEMNESIINTTKVIPHAYPRSRFVSD